jgi:cell wall-associated NlpC family hydrolase
LTRRALAAVAVLAALTALLAGCGGGLRSTVKIRQSAPTRLEGRLLHMELVRRAKGEARLTAITASKPRLSTLIPAKAHPRAAKIALQYLGVPYVWGGASPHGFDASGLVTYVYSQLGIKLPHYTVSQWGATAPIKRSHVKPGDLVFFDGLGHVGIYIGHGEFVHAPHTGAVVQITSLTGSWRKSLDGFRRVP